jgi:mannan endo-1,4-beta-mannosidase
MKKLSAIIFIFIAPLIFGADITIDTSKDRTPISPYIYGVNQDIAQDVSVTARRLGGNRMTGYNWENNASNAGQDWQQSSDNYLADNMNMDGPADKTAGVIMAFHDKSIKLNAYSLITLQLAGYVAKDKNGPVAVAEKAPSDRWAKVIFKKGAPFADEPDKNDGAVYLDEELNFLIKKYGTSKSATGIKGYALDNEPDIWAATHPRLHMNKTGVEEYINQSIGAAETVKASDPDAEIFGPASYGFNGFKSFQDAPDWQKPSWTYEWFLDYYLARMKEASDAKGKRLLDVLDVHWYPEATGAGHRIVFSQNAADITADARVQAPRSLWDPEYTETSWICSSGNCPLRLIPRLNEKIKKYYPGTKLAFTEYEYGAGYHISGGLALADVLGIYGKYGVYMANYWMVEFGSYTLSAFRLFRNYDGLGSKYGNINVKAQTKDAEKMSVYASVDSSDNKTLHIIIINKDHSNTQTARVSIVSEQMYKNARVYGFDKADGAAITLKQEVSEIKSNTFSITIPPFAAYQAVLVSQGAYKKKK